VITALLVLTVAAVVGFGVALAVKSKREFAAQNEVVPGTPSPAPASWAGAHSREAKLHRRLGEAVRGAHANPRFVELGLAAQMKAIETEALGIDERLVAAASLSQAHRDAAVDLLEHRVVALEATIADMVTSISVADSKAQLEQAVSDADVKLQALAEARAEVEMIDRRIAGTAPTSLDSAQPAQPPAPATVPAPPQTSPPPATAPQTSPPQSSPPPATAPQTSPPQTSSSQAAPQTHPAPAPTTEREISQADPLRPEPPPAPSPDSGS
jgi:hypothetical protein